MQDLIYISIIAITIIMHHHHYYHHHHHHHHQLKKVAATASTSCLLLPLCTTYTFRYLFKPIVSCSSAPNTNLQEQYYFSY